MVVLRYKGETNNKRACFFVGQKRVLSRKVWKQGYVILCLMVLLVCYSAIQVTGTIVLQVFVFFSLWLVVFVPTKWMQDSTRIACSSHFKFVHKEGQFEQVSMASKL